MFEWEEQMAESSATGTRVKLLDRRSDLLHFVHFGCCEVAVIQEGSKLNVGEILAEGF